VGEKEKRKHPWVSSKLKQELSLEVAGFEMRPFGCMVALTRRIYSREEHIHSGI
jgi:hypothetical protein